MPGLDAVASAAESTAGLDLLIVFGSRARDDAQPGADWDFGFLAHDKADVPGLLAAIVDTIGDDRIDLVDLRRASGLLRYRAAKDGRLIYEATPGLFDQFRLDATRFWCEAAPLLQRGYEEVLEALPQ